MYDVSLFFFFKQKTAYELRISDWSSDVCSSDLALARHLVAAVGDPAVGLEQHGRPQIALAVPPVARAARLAAEAQDALPQPRSEERSVGKESVSPCRSRWSPNH